MDFSPQADGTRAARKFCTAPLIHRRHLLEILVHTGIDDSLALGDVYFLKIDAPDEIDAPQFEDS